MPANDVVITITDGALGNALVLPGNVQCVVGCSSGGLVASGIAYATASKSTIIANSGYGPLTEAACMKIDAGATVLVVQTPTVTAGASGAITHVGTGTSVWTFSVGVSFDDYRFLAKVGTGGTQGVADGKTIQISLDAGRTYGPLIALGSAVTYVVAQTGLTLAFAAGTFVAGDTFAATNTAPLWNQAGLSAAITALNATTFVWGAGIHIVGKAAGADATSIEGYLDTIATSSFRYTFCWLDVRDFATADVTEAAWITAINADYSAVSATRIIAGAGWYNMTSSVVNQIVGGLPRYRRPSTWASSLRSLTIPQGQLISRVSDGPLGRIVVNPTTDPTDGYIYHDERLNPGLGPSGASTGRFCAMRTRPGLTNGFFVDEPAMMSPPGSDFSLLAYRQVADIACTLLHAILQNYINSSVRLNATGTILERDARVIEAAGNGTLFSNMTSQGMISAATFVLSRTDNIATTKTLSSVARLLALGYLLEIDTSLGFQSPFQVQGS